MSVAQTIWNWLANNAPEMIRKEAVVIYPPVGPEGQMKITKYLNQHSHCWSGDWNRGPPTYKPMSTLHHPAQYFFRCSLQFYIVVPYSKSYLLSLLFRLSIYFVSICICFLSLFDRLYTVRPSISSFSSLSFFISTCSHLQPIPCHSVHFLFLHFSISLGIYGLLSVCLIAFVGAVHCPKSRHLLEQANSPTQTSVLWPPACKTGLVWTETLFHNGSVIHRGLRV
jgi:hypothetical protein